jgi:hypothetical protein
MDGRIWVSNHLGPGSVFSFALPGRCPDKGAVNNMSAAMDTVENPIPRDLRREESLTCTFVILGAPMPDARPQSRLHLQPLETWRILRKLRRCPWKAGVTRQGHPHSSGPQDQRIKRLPK